MASEVLARKRRPGGDGGGKRPQAPGAGGVGIDVAPQVGKDLIGAAGVGERVRRLVSPVVAEDPCRDRSISGAADRVEQAQVVGIFSLLLAQTGALGELDGKQAGA